MGADDGTGATGDDGAKAAEPPESGQLLPRLPSLSEMGLLEKRPPMLPALSEAISNTRFAAKVYDWGGEMMTTATSGRHHPVYPIHRSLPGYHALSQRPPHMPTAMGAEMMDKGVGLRRGSWHPYEEHFHQGARPTLPLPGDYRIKYGRHAAPEYASGDRPSHPPLSLSLSLPLPLPLPYLAGVPWREAGPIPNRGLPGAPYGTDYGLPRRGIVTSPSMPARGHGGSMMAMEALMAAAARYPAAGPLGSVPERATAHANSGDPAGGEPQSAETASSPPQMEQQQQHHCDFPGCSKSFPSKSRLQRHTFVHTGERPFACIYPQCERHFSRKDNMLQHYRTHLVKGPSTAVPSKREALRVDRR